MSRCLARVRIQIVLVISLGLAAPSAPSAWGQSGGQDANAPRAAELCQMAAQLAKQGDAGATERAALAEQIWQTYLQTDEAARTLSVARWNLLYRCLRDVPGVHDWAPRIWSAFANDPKAATSLLVFHPSMGEDTLAAALPKMPPLALARLGAAMRRAGPQAQARHAMVMTKLAEVAQDVNSTAKLKPAHFGRVCRELKLWDAQAAAGPAVAWLTQSASWRTARIQGLNSVVQALEQATAAEKEQIAQQVGAALQDEAIAWGDCARLSEAWARVKQADAARDWAFRAYDAALGTDEARQKATLATLTTLCEAFEYAGLIGKGRGCPEAAEALAGLAREGKLGETGWRLLFLPGCLLGTAETVEMVRAELLDEQGRPRLPVVKILTAASILRRECNVWQKFLADRAAATTDKDVKARWMLASAHAASVVPGMRTWRVGKNWLNELFAGTQEVPERLQGLRDVVRFHVLNDMPAKAEALLDEGVGLLGDVSEDVAKELDALRTQIADAKEQWRQKEAAVMRARAEMLEQAAAEAAQKGDEAARAALLHWANQCRAREAELLNAASK